MCSARILMWYGYLRQEEAVWICKNKYVKSYYKNNINALVWYTSKIIKPIKEKKPNCIEVEKNRGAAKIIITKFFVDLGLVSKQN